MKGPVAKKEDLGTILLQAKCAAKTLRAQRDRLLHFQLQPQQQSPGDAEQLGSAIVDAAYLIEIGAKSLGLCLEIAARNGVPPSLPRALAALEENKLLDRLLTLRLPRRPVTQAHAFARVEAAVYAIYAVMLNLQRCVDVLCKIAHPACAATDESSQDSLPDPVVAATEHLAKIGLKDPEAAATEHLAKIGLPDSEASATEHLANIGLSDPEAAVTEHLAKISLSDPDAAATEPTQDSSNIGLPAPAAAATGEPLSQETGGSMDLDQARTCLDRSCTLASLAVKHVDLAVSVISSCVDPKDVARISDLADFLAIV